MVKKKIIDNSKIWISFWNIKRINKKLSKLLLETLYLWTILLGIEYENCILRFVEQSEMIRYALSFHFIGRILLVYADYRAKNKAFIYVNETSNFIRKTFSPYISYFFLNIWHKTLGCIKNKWWNYCSGLSSEYFK